MRTGKVARIVDRVRKELGELTPQERDLAVKALRDALYEGFALDAATSDPNRMEACVRCGSIRIIRKGRGRDGSQRWKCMNCNRTFGVEVDDRAIMRRVFKLAHICGSTSPSHGR